jgi:hypothetical protein
MVKAFEAYIIRNSQPMRIIPLQVTGGINQALANIVILPQQSYQTGMCRKNNPISPNNKSEASRAPVSQFARNQVWRQQQVYPLPISDTHLRTLQKTD